MAFPKSHNSGSLLSTDKTIKHAFDSSDRRVLATHVNKVWHKWVFTVLSQVSCSPRSIIIIDSYHFFTLLLYVEE
ncbi:hypothetical protein AHAS_Ahas13G0398100 [Arachis hypogaea]